MKNILLIGLGRFGKHIAIQSSQLGHEIMATLGFSPHPPVSVYGTGAYITIAAFLDSWLIHFPTLVRYASRLQIEWWICLPFSYLACPGLSIPGLYSPSVSPHF